MAKCCCGARFFSVPPACARARALALVAALALAASAAGAETRVIATEHFDIVYPERSAGTAQALAAVVDSSAEEICASLGASMPPRVPVYVNPDREEFNAYFTPYLYNRIVVYDAVPVDGPVAGSADPMLRAFRHELAHLVSMNIRSPFWSAVSAAFGDVVSVNSAVTMTPSLIEGVTVSLESADGAGRLNDPLVLHELSQAKLEGVRRTFKDVSGARDAHPGMLLSYYYGGAFSAWLQNAYGMEAYAEFWERGGSFNPLFSWIRARFAQVYPVSLDEAWSVFLDSIELPADVGRRGERLEGTADGVLSCLASGRDGVVWLDSSAGAVFFLGASGRAERLFAADGSTHRLSLSADGGLLLVSSFAGGPYSSQDALRVFDMRARRFTGEAYGDFRDASFDPSGLRVAAVRVSGQTQSLVTFARSSSARVETLAVAGPGASLGAIYSPTFVGASDTVAFIAVRADGRRVMTVDGATRSRSVVSFPFDAGFVRSLQPTPDGSLSFGWAKKGELYRYAVWDPVGGSVRAQRDMASGACFFPVVESSAGSVVCVSSFAESDSLSRFAGVPETCGVATVESDATAESAGEISDDMPLSDETSGDGTSHEGGLFESKPYQPFPWFRDGVLYPFLSSVSTGYGETSFGARLTYLTEDPTETFGLLASAAYFPRQSFVDWTLQGTYSPASVVCSLALSDRLLTAIPSDGPYRQLSADASVSASASSFADWKRLSATLGATVHGYAAPVAERGRAYDAPIGASSVGAYAEASYDAVKRPSLRPRALFPAIASGWRAEAFAYAGVVNPDRAKTYLAETLVEASVPGLPLTIELAAARADGLTFVPGVTLFRPDCAREYAWTGKRLYRQFPEYDATPFAGIGSDAVLTANAEVTAIDLSPQKGVPFLPLFANDAVVTGGYRCGAFGLSGATVAYVDSAFVAGTVRGSAVIGALTRVVFSARVEYAWPLRAGGRYRTVSFGMSVPY